jgi:hypothetical protein
MPIVAKLEISMTETGQVSVTGCIDNQFVSYALLEVAHDVVHEHCVAAAKLVQPAPAGSVEFLAAEARARALVAR